MEQQMLMQPVEAVELTAVEGGDTSLLGIIDKIVGIAHGLGLGSGGDGGGSGSGGNVYVNCIGDHACGNVSVQR